MDTSSDNSKSKITTLKKTLEHERAELEKTKQNFERQQRLLEEKTTVLTEENVKLLQQNELFAEQALKIAEANVKLLEQQEQLEEQKIKLAEANLMMLEQKEIIEQERERSEKLLLNILPEKVVSQLKDKGKTLPESFDNVTVFFSDIVNFTQIASTLEPAFLISELNDIFTAFDNISKNNHCERIKTIGDAYLCVCGMPEQNDNHAENIIKSSIEVIDFLNTRNRSTSIKWEIRVGIHSGKVVGGVVGIDKYIYDVFGDTINTASRMELHSEPMAINVSEDTYKLVQNKFTFQERAPIEVKGKGKKKMYFVSME